MPKSTERIPRRVETPKAKLKEMATVALAYLVSPSAWFRMRGRRLLKEVSSYPKTKEPMQRMML
jgi:hypothetical protein